MFEMISDPKNWSDSGQPGRPSLPGPEQLKVRAKNLERTSRLPGYEYEYQSERMATSTSQNVWLPVRTYGYQSEAQNVWLPVRTYGYQSGAAWD